MSYAATIAGLGATYHWPLNETSGTTINDVIGANNGTYAEHATLNQDPLISDGRSVLFSGTNNVRSKTSVGVNTDNAFSLLAWMSFTSTGDNDGISQDNGAGTGRSLIGCSAGQIRTIFGGIATTTSTNKNDGEPKMVVLTFSGGVGGNLTLYVNREIGIAATRTGGGATGVINIGGPKTGIVTTGWIGNIDEVAFWEGTELTEENISTLYTAALGVGGLLQRLKYGLGLRLGLGI